MASSLISMVRYFEVEEPKETVEPLGKVEPQEIKNELSIADVESATSFLELAEKVSLSNEPKDEYDRASVSAALKLRSEELIGQEIAEEVLLRISEVTDTMESKDDAGLKLATVREVDDLSGSDFSVPEFGEKLDLIVSESARTVVERICNIEPKYAKGPDTTKSTIVESVEKNRNESQGLGEAEAEKYTATEVINQLPLDDFQPDRTQGLIGSVVESIANNIVGKIESIASNPLRALKIYGQTYGGPISKTALELYNDLATNEGREAAGSRFAEGINRSMNDAIVYGLGKLQEAESEAIDMAAKKLLGDDGLEKVQKFATIASYVKNGNISGLIRDWKKINSGFVTDENGITYYKPKLKGEIGLSPYHFGWNSVKYGEDKWYLENRYDWVITLEKSATSNKHIPMLEDYIYGNTPDPDRKIYIHSAVKVTETIKKSGTLLRKGEEKTKDVIRRVFLPIMNYNLSGERLNPGQAALMNSTITYPTGKYAPPSLISITLPNVINFNNTRVNAIYDWLKDYSKFMMRTGDDPQIGQQGEIIDDSPFRSSLNMEYRDYRECCYKLSLYRTRINKIGMNNLDWKAERYYLEEYLVMPDVSLVDEGSDTKGASGSNIQFYILGGQYETYRIGL